MPRKQFNVLAQQLQAVMEESLPSMVDNRVKEVTKTQVSIYVAEGLLLERNKMQHEVAQIVADAIQKERKTSEHGTYVMGESSSGQANESESDPSTSDAVDEAKLRKVVAEMLRQRCTSRDEHQYHMDQMQNFLKNGNEHKFVTEVIVRRANDSIVSITEPNYKNLNKNDIEDMYFLCINGKVGDYAETELLW
nr:hypothetical protein [Tanacetum cinerariifolium]